MKSFDIQKYIRKNPPQDGKIFRSCDGFFSFAVVVPMLNENANAADFFKTLKTAIADSNEKILIAAVVNCAANSPDDFKADNQKLLMRLLANEFEIPNLAVIDCTSENKYLKNGVGEARKTGMDFVLNHFDFNDFENAVIASLDADTIIDKNYFTAIRENFKCNPDCGALTFNVCHRNDAANPAALARYELYMKSYYEGLKYAESPYAFYTVGSAFAVRASSYIHAGGMRKLKAGEDFYFLQSVVKSSKVRHCPAITVYPSARFSPRVPFGTGTALQSISNNEKEYSPYPQHAFDSLKKVIENAVAEKLASPEKYLASLPQDLPPFFEQYDFISDWRKVAANMPQSQLPPAFLHHWFDGLKTLQFIKYCTANCNHK